jgi:hypothetical protein
MKELEPKQAMVAKKLFEIYKKFTSDRIRVEEFLIWFGDMEKQNWNGVTKNGKKKA